MVATLAALVVLGGVLPHELGVTKAVVWVDKDASVQVGCEVVSTTDWRCEVPEAPRGTAHLRLAIAGSGLRRGVEVSVNDAPTSGTGPLPNTGVMHRDGIRGYWCERDVVFEAKLLKRGTNVIKLKAPATGWVDGVLYDYLRLELDEGASLPKNNY